MIIIGDVHGNYDTLMALVAQFPKDQKIVLVGDLIDRGPKSRQVVQWAIDNNIDCVMGNHEDMMIENDRNYWNSVWMMNGGIKTLESYGEIDIDEPTFEQHRRWMEKLPIILAYPDCKNEEDRMLVVSHSSCGMGWDWDDVTKVLMDYNTRVLWGRGKPVDAPAIYNVFGHTPQPRILIDKHYANVDTGSYLVRKPGEYGILTGLQYPEMIVYTQPYLGS